jgi:lycopene beta-cyclase
MKEKYDYIICGAGLSGLILASRIFEDRFFDDKNILLIDKDLKSSVNKTWCFWETGNSVWKDYIVKSWDTVIFKSKGFKKEKSLQNYSYKMIKSKFFLDSIIYKIKQANNFDFFQDEIVDFIESENNVLVKTKSNQFLANNVFNSCVDIDEIKSKTSYPFLLQHFLGWTIETEESVFNEKKATIMDFSIDQKDETRFFYVLPISDKKALIEFTVFSKDLLKKDEYELELKKYIKSLKIDKYKIIENEFGVIPMTCYPFERKNTSKILNIGTAGGWTKPSSGYTFKFIEKNTTKLLAHIKKNTQFSNFKIKTRHWIYDLIFLDVLYKNNYLGSNLFTKMFSKNPMEKIFMFLDNETSITDELKITASFPKRIFTNSLVNNIGKIIRGY